MGQQEEPKKKIYWDIRAWWGTRTNLEKSNLKEKYYPGRGYFSPNDKELFCICHDEGINIEYKTGE